MAPTLITKQSGDRLIIVASKPGATEQGEEVGQIIGGAFQPTLFTDAGLTAAVQRQLCDLIQAAKR